MNGGANVKIMITGAGGMLGSAMVPELVAAGHEVIPSDIDLREPRPWGELGPAIHRLDVRSATEVGAGIDAARPDLVVHLAAETDLEVCEEDPDHAFATNAVGTKHVALACRSAGVPLAYVSTAGVFDGTKDGPYTEYDTPNPINVYGHSKLEGERYVQWFVDRFYIIRAGWMVGGGAKDHKFVAKILAQLNEGASTLYVVSDKLGTPTYTPDFSLCFRELIAAESYGLYHMACEGMGSRFDVAAHLLELLGRTDVDLVDVDSQFFAAEYFAPRPRSEIMRNLVLDLQGMNHMRPWRTALEEYLLQDLGHLGDGVKRTIDLALHERRGSARAATV